MHFKVEILKTWKYTPAESYFKQVTSLELESINLERSSAGIQNGCSSQQSPSENMLILF